MVYYIFQDRRTDTKTYWRCENHKTFNCHFRIHTCNESVTETHVKILLVHIFSEDKLKGEVRVGEGKGEGEGEGEGNGGKSVRWSTRYSPQRSLRVHTLTLKRWWTRYSFHHHPHPPTLTLTPSPSPSHPPSPSPSPWLTTSTKWYTGGDKIIGPPLVNAKKLTFYIKKRSVRLVNIFDRNIGIYDILVCLYSLFSSFKCM